MKATWAIPFLLAPACVAGGPITAANDRPFLAEAGASRIEQRTGLVGLRKLDLPVRALRASVPQRADLCLNRSRTGYPRPVCNSNEPSYGDCLWAAIDSVPWEGDYEWSSDYRNPAVPVYEVEFGKTVTVAEIRLWLRRVYTLRDFDVQWRDAAGEWHEVATVRGNRETLRRFTFHPVRATAIGVTCVSGPSIQPTIRRILEIEAFAPSPPAPSPAPRFAYRLDLPVGPRRFIRVREAYGEGETMGERDYDLLLDGKPIYRRVHRCDGPGPISYAVPVPPTARGTARLTFVDRSGQGIAIARVEVMANPVATVRRAGELKPLVVAPRIDLRPPYTDPGPEEQLRGWLAAAAPARRYVRPGLLAIVGYAHTDQAAVAARIRAYAALARKCGVPWVLQLSSWWADTPLHEPDGLGGHFGDIRYQQIGYSKLDTYEDPGLKGFMEAEAPGSYNVHYGLTVPNIWSNTPWLTMANPVLNRFKVECLTKTMATVNQVRAGEGGELLTAIVTDDEPLYWTRGVDGLENGYVKVNGGVMRSDLMLDFNPAVVRAAAADGIKLDPTDGLTPDERAWLNLSNARYVSLIVEAIHQGLAPAVPGRPDLRDRIFNYLLAQPIFPLDDLGHPAWERGMVPHAAIGLEAFDERYFVRARDLGPLANSDFECARPTPGTVNSWEPLFRAWHDTGCSFVQLCNPGAPGNWTGLFQQIGKWSPEARDTERAISLLVQKAAMEEWRGARFAR